MDNFEKDNVRLIKNLSRLKEIVPSAEFRNYLGQKILLTQEQSTFIASPYGAKPIFALRLAVIALVFVFLGSASVVLASSYSHPGDFLYPVKTTIQSFVKGHQMRQPDMQPDQKINKSAVPTVPKKTASSSATTKDQTHLKWTNPMALPESIGEKNKNNAGKTGINKIGDVLANPPPVPNPLGNTNDKIPTLPILPISQESSH